MFLIDPDDRVEAMCNGIALAWSALPEELIDRHGLASRAHDRGGEREVQFLYQALPRCLPAWHDGQLRLYRWGGGRHQSRCLPCTGWTWRSTIDAGGWTSFDAVPVDIPATMGLELGVWFRIRQGIRGLLIHDEWDCPAVYMICEPASHYYRVMTRSTRMPVLIEERI